MSDSDSDFSVDVKVEEATVTGLLPAKSKALYEGSYKKFDEWRAKNKFRSVDEKCMLAYFSQEMGSRRPSTKWSHYSMLKTTINMNMGINIGGFLNLMSYLKQKSDGYHPKKSKTLTKEQIIKFLQDANDDTYLATKVVLIVGVYGACRREEILKLRLNDIEYMEDSVKITIPNTRTNVQRQFVITKGNALRVDMLNLFRTYAQKRPAGITHSRFFVGYRFGKCTKQAIGINTLGRMPKTIAEFLKLPSPQEYTGHCFRRSSASLLTDFGVDICVLKRHGGWKTSTVDEGYVENFSQQNESITVNVFGDSGGNSGNSNEAYNVPPESPDLPSSMRFPHLPDFSFAVPSSMSFTPTTSSSPNPVQINYFTNCTINVFQNKG